MINENRLPIIVPSPEKPKVPVILFMGFSGGGKDRASDVFHDQSSRSPVYKTGNYLRDRIKEEHGIESPSDNQLYEFGKTLQPEGHEYALAEQMVLNAQQKYELGEIDAAGFNGLRRFAEYNYMVNEWNALPLFVFAAPGLRYYRRRERRDARDRQTWEEFLAMDNNQAKELWQIYNQVVHKGVVIMNNGTLSEFQRSTRAVIQRHYPYLLPNY